MRNDERIEHIDHRDARADHAVCHNALGRIDRRPAYRYEVVRKRRSRVAGRCGAVENAAEQIFTETHFHPVTEKFNVIARGNAAAAGENLQRHDFSVDLIDFRKRFSEPRFDFREFSVADIVGFYRDDVAGDRFDSRIYFIHIIHRP